MNNFQKVDNESFKANERNDCAVKAIAIACNVPYKVAHRCLEKYAGRKHRRGTMTRFINGSIKKLGFDVTPHDVTAKTITTIARDTAVQDGFYVVYVRGHMAAIVNGQIEDWTEGKRHRVKSVYKVTPSKSRAERKSIMKQLFN